MNTVKSIGAITWEDAAEYLHLQELEYNEIQMLGTIIDSVRSYILTYTGMTTEAANACGDLVIPALILIQGAWDNRTLYVDKGTVNPTVTTILDLHSVNLL